MLLDRIDYLKPGDHIPPGEPVKYKDGVLSWKVGPRYYKRLSPSYIVIKGIVFRRVGRYFRTSENNVEASSIPRTATRGVSGLS